jgi:hypothetical protein
MNKEEITKELFYNLVEENELVKIEEVENYAEGIGGIVEYNDKLKIYFICIGYFGTGFTEYSPKYWSRNKKYAIAFLRKEINGGVRNFNKIEVLK